MAQPTIDINTKEQSRIWLLPPYNYSLRRIANELSIGAATVSKWRKELISEDLLNEDVEQKTENFTAEQIFSFVIETSTMTEHELAEYCRSKGLFVEKVKEWRTISIQAHQSKAESQYKQDSIPVVLIKRKYKH
jgi:transposase-like protein